MIDLNKIYYIAGLLEGEGCFGFYKCPVIQIHMTDLEPVQKIRNIMCPNVRIRIQNKGKYNVNSKTQYILHFSGQLSIEWMMTLYSLMSPRRQEQIRTVIVKWKSMSKETNHLKLVQYNRERA